MARVFPSNLTKLVLIGAPRPGLTTLALLKQRLPDEFTVFQGAIL